MNKNVDMYNIRYFNLNYLTNYDVIIIGSYTWGNGNIPKQMEKLFQAFEERDTQHIITGVFGTGDSFYPYFCGAVDKFRDMLYVHTKLTVTLKVELLPQNNDKDKCSIFAQKIVNKSKSYADTL